MGGRLAQLVRLTRSKMLVKSIRGRAVMSFISLSVRSFESYTRRRARDFSESMAAALEAKLTDLPVRLTVRSSDFLCGL